MPRRLHSLVKFGDRGFPAEFSLNLGDICIEFRRVARSSLTFLDGEIHSRDSLGGFNALSDRETLPDSDVVVSFVAILEGIDDANMGVYKIVYVDIISNTRSIVGWIVGTKNGHSRPLPECGVKANRDQVRFRPVILTDMVGSVTSSHIEVPEGGVREWAICPAVCLGDITQHPFALEL